jgi:hypothetical protein
VCRAPIDPHSDEAEFLTLRIVVLFQQGITDEIEVKARLAAEP